MSDRDWLGTTEETQQNKEAEGVAEELSAAGCIELILIAQDVSFYGLDLYGVLSLPQLLRKLCRISGLRWFRLMYLY